MAFRISVESTCPVGLCGLVTTTSFVPGAMAVRMSSAAGSHRASARSAKIESLVDRRRVHARLGQVVAHPVLPGALPALQLERNEPHGTSRWRVLGVGCQ